MQLPAVNYVAVLVSGIVIFMLGGVWYSPVLFAKPWMRLMGKNDAQLRAASGAMPVLYLFAFVCGLLVAWTVAIILNHFANLNALRGAMVGALCWAGFAGATSFATALFSMTPKRLWFINSGYNLVSFVLAGIILAIWR